MKKFLSLFLALVLIFSIIPLVYAEDTNADLESESKFEKVLLKKGTLLTKEFIDVGDFGDYLTKCTCQKAILTDVETTEKYYALRLSSRYYNSEYDSGTIIGVLDLDEIESAITTLKYVKEHISEAENYTEITYTSSSGMELGGYHNDSEFGAFIKFNSRITNIYSMQDLDSMITLFEEVRYALAGD